jgi:hypothetical protein
MDYESSFNSEYSWHRKIEKQLVPIVQNESKIEFGVGVGANVWT